MGFPAARLTDMHVCPMVTGVVPHVGGPITSPGMTNVLVMGLVASRLADFATCAGGPDTITKGAASVLLGGLPATRLTDMTIHGGIVTAPGAPTVLIGDPAFVIPANFVFSGTPDFNNKVIRDLYLLSTTPTGAAQIARLEAAGETITFTEHLGTNGFCSPADGARAQAGDPTGSRIQYNPNYRSNAYDSSGNLIAQPPQIILSHEMGHAVNNSEGTHHYGTDSAPPASQPSIAEEEASAIGTGSHSGDGISENTLRDDLGLPRRDNHFGTGGPAAGEPAPVELRPGGY